MTLGRRLRGLPALAAAMVAAATLAVAPATVAQEGGAQEGGAQTLRIIAVVNDDIVTEFDLAVRLQLVIRSSGLPDSAEVRNRLAPQLLRQLIDERLQMQEAARRGVEVTEEEFGRAMAQLEADNNIPEGQLPAFIERIGIPYQALIERIRVDLTWQKLQAQRLRPTIEITSDEIEEVLSRILANQGSAEFRVAEIFLAVDNPAQEQEVRDSAQRMLDDLARGASFAALARQFSQSASAGVGGDLGWIYPGQLDAAIDQVLPELSVGEVSTPIRTASGYYLVALIDRRTISGPSPEDVTLTYQVISLPLADSMPADEQAAQRDLARTVAELANGCDDMSQIAAELGAGEQAPPVTARLRDLGAADRAVLDQLVMQRPSQPIEQADRVSVYMVCDRQAPEGALPPRDEIEENLLQEKTAVLAQRLLRDLRQAAFIDVRV